MPLPLLALLGLGGLGASVGGQRALQRRDIENREQGLLAQVGQPGLPGLGGTGLAGQLSQEGDPTQVAQLELALKLASDPATASTGNALITQLFSQRGQTARQGAALAQDQGQFVASEAQDLVEQQRRLGQDQRQFDVDQSRRTSEFNDLKQREFDSNLLKTRFEAAYKNVPTGFEPVLDDKMNSIGTRPKLFTPQYNETVSKILETNNSVKSVRRLRELTEELIETGAHRPKFGPLTRELKAEQSSLVSAIAKLRGFGTIQPGELEFINETALPDITGFGRESLQTALRGFEVLEDKFLDASRIQSRTNGLINSYGLAPIEFAAEGELLGRFEDREIERRRNRGRDPALPEGFTLEEAAPARPRGGRGSGRIGRARAN